MSYQFMMEVELNLEGRNVEQLSLECEDYFDEQGQKLADIVKSDSLPCKLFTVKLSFLDKNHMIYSYRLYSYTAGLL